MFADPAALISLDKFVFTRVKGGLDYVCDLCVKLVWKRLDRLSARNPRLDHFMEPLDLLDGVKGALDGYKSMDLVKEVRLKELRLANDQQTNYKAFHKSFECYLLTFEVRGFEEEVEETVRLGSLGEVRARVRYKEIKRVEDTGGDF